MLMRHPKSKVFGAEDITDPGTAILKLVRVTWSLM